MTLRETVVLPMADNTTKKSSSITVSETSSRTLSVKYESTESLPSPQDDCMLKLAALMYLRIKKQTNVHFTLNVDVKETGIMNVLFLDLQWTERNGRDRWITYLVAPAHIRNASERNDSPASHRRLEDVLAQEDQAARITETQESLDMPTYWQIFKSALAEMNLVDLDDETGESKSHTKRNGSCRFIIYTTDTLTRNIKPVISTNVDFPFLELFATGDTEDIVSFSDEFHPDVGEDRETEFYYKFFLPHLRIFAKQRGPMDLNPLIEQELACAEKDLTLDSGELLLAYMDWMKEWRVEDENCLTDTSVVLEKAVMKKMMDEDHPRDVRFSETECKNVIRQINTDIVYISIPDISKQIRSCKVAQALRIMHKNNFFILSGRILSNYKSATLSKLCDRACDAVVINSDLTEESIQILNTIATERLKNIIVISTDFAPTLCQMLLSLQRTYKEWTEVWTLNELEDSQQEDLMECSVSFQGRLVCLQILENVWPTLRSEIHGSMLNALLTGQIGVLGAELVPYTVWDPYINRILCHRTPIKPEVLQLNTDRDIIMVTGVPKKLLNDMMNQAGRENQSVTDSPHVSSNPNSNNLTGNKSQSRFEYVVDCESKAAVAVSGGVDIGYSRRYTGDLTRIDPPEDEPNKKVLIFSYAESSVLSSFRRDLHQYTEHSINYTGKNIHWVSYDRDILTWKNSFGSDDKILKYIVKMGNSCINAPICAHSDTSTYKYDTWKLKVVTLTGGSGMGKTTVLRKIASDLWGELKSYWIIEINLSKNRFLMETSFESEEISLSEIVEFLYCIVQGQDSTNPTVCRNFLNYSVETGGNCVVLFDGLDELEDTPKQTALKLIKKLSETNVGQIWVSMTEKDELDVNRSLCGPPLEIQPLDVEEQADYLSERWALENDMRHQAEIYNPVAETVTECLPFCDGTALFSVPLYLFLFAGTYVPPPRNFDVVKYAEGLGNDLPHCSVFRLYRDYVLKFERSERRRQEAATSTPARSKKSKKKKKGAAQPPPPPAPPPVPEVDLTCEAFYRRSQKLAAHVTCGNTQMVHRSFSEFYLALWLKENHATLGIDYLRQSVLPPAGEYHGVRSQLDWLLADGLLLHEVAVSGEDVSESDVVWDGGRLHARDLVGRTALHVAAMYAREDLVYQLLQAGAETDVEDEVRQWTPLDYADATCNLAIIEMLLEQGGDPSRLKTLREKSEDEKLQLMLKRAYVLHEMKDKCRSDSLVFVVPASDIDPEKLGLTEDLINNKDDCFNEDTVLFTLELPRPYVFPLPQIAFKGYTHVAKYLLENNCADDPCLFSVSALHTAAYYGRHNIVKLLLDHGLECNKRKHDGQTPLHVASKQLNLNTVQVLLKAGADVNARDKFWMTPAMLAAASGMSEVLKALIKHGIHLESADQRGRTALYHAVDENKMDTVKVLLEAGANVYTADKFEIHPLQVAIAKGFSEIVLEMYQHADITKHRDLFGATPLHHTCAYQQLDLLVKLLVKKHAVNVSDCDGVTPLHIAAKVGNLKFVDILLKRGADGKAKDRNGLNALHYATMGGNCEIIELLIQMGVDDRSGKSNYEKCIFLAAMVGKVEAMKTLLKHGAVIDKTNPRHCSLLHYGNVSKNDEIIRLLLDVGIDPNVQEYSAKNAPLHIAVKSGVLKIVEMLLEKGAKPNVTTQDGRTPLHLAAISGHVCIAEALLKHGADPNIADCTNYTPVILATRFKNTGVLKVLVDAGGNTNILEGNQWSVLHVAVIECDMATTEYLLSTGMEINLTDSRGFTPLLLACGGNAKLEFIKFLIGRGADETAIDSQYQRTALHNAAYRGKIDVVAFLLELGLDVDSEDIWGSTPLHMAALLGQTKCAIFLVNKGADVNAFNSLGETPLHKAFASKRKNTVQALMDLGADPRNVKFHELDIWGGFVERAEYVRNPVKLLQAPEQNTRRSPIKRMSASTPRRKNLIFVSNAAKVPRKVEKVIMGETERKLGTSEEVDIVRSHRLFLVPPEDVDLYFPPNEELKDVSWDHISWSVSSHSPQPGSAKQTPSPGPSKQTPSPGPSKQTPSRGPSKQTPSRGPSKQTPPPGSSKQTPPPGSSKQTPPPGPKSTPTPGSSKNIPKQKQSKNVPKQEESCDVTQKDQSILAESAISQNVKGKKSKNEKLKDSPAENILLKEGKDVPTKAQPPSTNQRRRRRR
ncbi:Poly [ADP-ribose] polymerase tankyrase [Gryllus bimaculatus]|nr:Poly [ADP-ribose] polymerase tankyrase [Gryllus bimaculatus]